MAPRWFVQTRGGSHEGDYGWRSVDGGDPHAAAAIVREGWQSWACVSSVGGRERLLDDEVPGLLLFSQSSTAPLTLLVTSLPPSRVRADYAHRSIRVNLLGVAAPGDVAAERDLVAVAVRALRGHVPAEALVASPSADQAERVQDTWSREVTQAVAELAVAGRASPELAGTDPAGTLDSQVVTDTPGSRESAARDLAALFSRRQLPAAAGRLLVLWTGIPLPAATLTAVRPVWGLRPDRPVPGDPGGGPAASPDGGGGGDLGPMAGLGTIGRKLAQTALDVGKEGVEVARRLEEGVETAKRMEQERRRRRRTYGIGGGLAVIGAVVGIAIGLSSGGTPSPVASGSASPAASATASASPASSPTPSPSPSAWQAEAVGALPPKLVATVSGVATLPKDGAVMAGTLCASAAKCSPQAPFVGFWNGTGWATESLLANIHNHALVAAPVVAATSLDDAWVFMSTIHDHSYALEGNKGHWTNRDLPDDVIVYAAVVTGPGKVWAFGAKSGRAYVARYVPRPKGEVPWQQVPVPVPGTPVATPGAVSAGPDGSVWMAITASEHRSILLRSTGGAFTQMGLLPETPAQVLAVGPHNVWVTGSAGVEHGDGSTKGWQVVSTARPAALACDGTSVLWVASNAIYHSVGGTPVAQPLTSESTGGRRLTALAWASGSTPQALWAVLSRPGPAGTGGATMVRYGLTQ